MTRAIRRSNGALKGGVLCTIAFIVGAAAVTLAGIELADDYGGGGPLRSRPLGIARFPAVPPSLTMPGFPRTPPPARVERLPQILPHPPSAMQVVPDPAPAEPPVPAPAVEGSVADGVTSGDAGAPLAEEDDATTRDADPRDVPQD